MGARLAVLRVVSHAAVLAKGCAPGGGAAFQYVEHGQRAARVVGDRQMPAVGPDQYVAGIVAAAGHAGHGPQRRAAVLQRKGGKRAASGFRNGVEHLPTQRQIGGVGSETEL